MKEMKVVFSIACCGILCLVASMILSCKERTIEKAPKKGEPTVVNEYPKPFGIDTELLEGWDHGIVLGSDNHEYLVLNEPTQDIAIMHYIDCKLCKTRK